MRILIFAALAAAGCKAPAAPIAIPPGAPDFAVFEEEEEEEAEPSAPPRAAEEEPRKCEPIETKPATGSTFTRTRATINALIRWQGAPSVAVAVGHAGEFVWAEGFGFADKARRRKATADTMYSLASVSKPFTATGIMVLRAQGKLELDEPINTYLGEGAVRAGVGEAKDATIERVANHTAGLPLHYRFFYDGKVPTYEKTRREFAVLVTKPGERSQYSNLGYGLLEQVLAKVSGKSYAEFMRTEVFGPLGLEKTAVGRPRRGFAVRYDVNGVAIPNYGFDHDGASAIYSSARDLVAFGMTHLGFVKAGAKPLLPPDALARMREIQAPAENYGMGWGVRRQGGYTLINHSGGMPGVRTVLALVPEASMVIAVLINGAARRGPTDVVAAVWTDLGLPVLADAICELKPDHPILGRFEGTVDGPKGPRPISLTLEHSGRVTAKIGNGPVLPLWAVRLRKRGLSARGFGTIGAAAASGKPTEISFDLQRRGSRLTGSITARVPGTAATTYFADLAKE